MGKSGNPGLFVDTDYDSYLIYYKCVEIEGGQRNEVVGISVRDPGATTE